MPSAAVDASVEPKLNHPEDDVLAEEDDILTGEDAAEENAALNTENTEEEK